MRDMLERLRNVSEEHEDIQDFEYDDNKLKHDQEAIVFENSSDIESILKEAQSIRKEISMLLMEVERLNKNNERFRTTVRQFTALKKDSDTIAKGIQKHGKDVHSRLLALSEKSKKLETKEGPNSAAGRIACMQYDSLICAFQAAMGSYNQAEEMQRTICRDRIKRQASILGTKISDNQLDDIVDKGCEGWSELSQSLQTQESHSSRWALCEIKDRHKELVALEGRLKEVHELFLEMALQTEEQCSMLNNIEANVCKSQDYTQKVNTNLKKAIQYKKKNPFQTFCPCFTCWRK
ncbi:syntaxin-11-like [Nerophis ophidion]|uniref:syntaxin-11-like n=1 Tax=Nerophis ophidion TaxID=159077 RepID=UPI002ADF7360|nr:syntaxin-11-like [Nerophis ophidion]XP_061756537.1 syntaxin-11-like [Nerophis ophidion]